jgi:N-methylhydantoinase B
VNGGHAGAPNRFVVRRDGREIMPSSLPGKVAAFALQPEDIVVMQTAGGGGFGEAGERDPAALARDLEFGYVSAEAARKLYQAEGDEISLTLRRADTSPGKRRAVLAPATAARLGLDDDGLIEILARGPSLRAWIQVVDNAALDALGLDRDGLDLLGAAPLDVVVLRRIGHSHV